jgi:hypothetical protein
MGAHRGPSHHAHPPDRRDADGQGRGAPGAAGAARPDDYLPTDIDTLHAPYAESVIATVVADLPSSVRSLAPTDLIDWDMSEQEVWARAWANTRRHPEPIDVATVEIAGGPMTVVHGEHFYTASRVRWLEDLVGPVAPFGALVAMPRRSTLLVHVIRDADVMSAIEPLVLNARLLHLEGPAFGERPRVLVARRRTALGPDHVRRERRQRRVLSPTRSRAGARLRRLVSPHDRG